MAGGLVQKWAREQQRYKSGEMRELLGIGNTEKDDERLSDALQQLKCAKVLRTVTGTESENDDDDADSSWDRRYVEKYDYCFRYVGLIQFGKHVLNILPKYCTETGTPDKGDSYKETFRTVMRAIARYKTEASSTGEEDSENAWHDFLHVMVELVVDFQANGVYRVDENINEVNGKGRIMWPRTIRRVLPFMQDGRPYYMELHTRRKQADTAHFITRLHKHLVWQAWQRLEELDLPALLGLPSITDPPDHEEEFTDTEYLVRMVKKEQAQRFDNRRRYLLNLMLRYLEEKDEDTTDGIYLFGKSGFHVVWEEACRAVFGMRASTTEEMESSKPRWEAIGGEPFYGDALKADMFQYDEANHRLLICDAKYYTPKIAEFIKHGLKGMPGIADIIKQQLYELALCRCYHVDTERAIATTNVFLMPLRDDEIKEGEQIINFGKGCIPMLTAGEDAPEPLKGFCKLQHIRLCKLSPAVVWDAYLNHRIIDIPKAFHE